MSPEPRSPSTGNPPWGPRLQRLLVLLLLVAGCGGGSGGGSGAGSGSGAPAPAPPQPAPPQPAPPPEPTTVLSGTLRIPAGHAHDSDVNDEAARVVRNDDLRPDVTAEDRALAQPVPVPALVSGYLADPGAGAPGPLQAPGDTSDFYRIDASGGERVLVYVPDPGGLDIDLELFRADGSLGGSSLGIGRLESATIPGPGTWYLHVFTFAGPVGASNYLLLVDDSATPWPAADLDLTASFRPDRSLVRLAADPAAAPAGTAAPGPGGGAAEPVPAAAPPGTGPVSEGRAKAQARRRAERIRRFAERYGHAVETFGSHLRLRHRAAPPGARPGDAKHALPAHHASRAGAWRTVAELKALRRDPAVLAADADRPVRPLLLPNDPFLPRQWHYGNLELPAAWDVTVGDPGTVTAIVDSGIRADHPDLAGRVLPDGWDFVSDPEAAGDGDGPDPDPTDPGQSRCSGAQPSVFHGTHVAGTVAARTDNGRGVAGVTWQGAVLPVRVLGCPGAGSLADVVEGIRYAAGLDNASGRLPARPASIVNLSLGAPGPCPATLQATLDEVRARGVVVVAAAGNDSRDGARQPVSTPANCRGVIAVGATTLEGRRAGYSNSGPELDVAAPGGDSTTDLNADAIPDAVYSTTAADFANLVVADRYDLLQGTSMATPHVSGVVALMRAVHPPLDPAELDGLLASGALTDDLGAPARDDDFGHGQINARKAVAAALTLATGGVVEAGPPRLALFPVVLDLGSLVSRAALTLTNGGGGALTVAGVHSDTPGVTAVPQDVPDPGTGLGTWRVTVDRGAFAAGRQQATLTVRSSAGDATVPVRFNVQSLEADRSAGVQYVSLVDAETGDIVMQQVVAPRNGEYPFAFRDVADGRYRIVSGSDNDNDFDFCDLAESCGAYITLEQPSELLVEASEAGLDFVTAYEQRLFELGLPGPRAEGRAVVRKGRAQGR